MPYGVQTNAIGRADDTKVFAKHVASPLIVILESLRSANGRADTH